MERASVGCRRRGLPRGEDKGSLDRASVKGGELPHRVIVCEWVGGFKKLFEGLTSDPEPAFTPHRFCVSLVDE